MSYETLDLQVSGTGVATLTLNRPDALNAMNDAMIADLIAVSQEINERADIRVVVFTGAGRAFCAGGDVREMLAHGQDRTAPELYAHLQQVNRVTLSLVNMTKPVISAVNGIATGAGVNMAISGDIIYAADDVKFSEIFGNIGLNPDMGGTYLLPRLVGRSKAKELVFTYRMVPAQEAKEIGLVNEIFPKDKLMTAAYDMAERLAKGPTHAYMLAKKMINQSFETSLERAMDLEGFCQVLSHLTGDYLEGITAFQEKRATHFAGK